MATVIDAIYIDGVLRPLETANLHDRQHYRLTVEELPPGATPRTDERVRVREALRAAGLLVDLSPTMRAQADVSAPIDEVRAAIDRAGGPPLSEIVLEQRGIRE